MPSPAAVSRPTKSSSSTYVWRAAIRLVCPNAGPLRSRDDRCSFLAAPRALQGCLRLQLQVQYGGSSPKPSRGTRGPGRFLRPGKLEKFDDTLQSKLCPRGCVHCCIACSAQHAYATVFKRSLSFATCLMHAVACSIQVLFDIATVHMHLHLSSCSVFFHCTLIGYHWACTLHVCHVYSKIRCLTLAAVGRMLKYSSSIVTPTAKEMVSNLGCLDSVSGILPRV